MAGVEEKSITLRVGTEKPKFESQQQTTLQPETPKTSPVDEAQPPKTTSNVIQFRGGFLASHIVCNILENNWQIQIVVVGVILQILGYESA